MRSDFESEGQKAETFIQATRRKQILDGAIETLAEVGFANASLARIAKDLRVSKGVISYHFESKDALMVKVVEHCFEGMIEAVVPKILAADGTIAGIHVHLHELALYALDHRSMLIALGQVAGNLRRSDGRLHFGAESNEALYPGLEQMYQHGQQAGELRDFDVRVMAITQQAAIDAMFAYWGNHPDHDLVAHADRLADLIVHAVRAGPESPSPRPPAKRSRTARKTTTAKKSSSKRASS
ncbi:TetR/AcrR family transcriptional regulator [Microlunatus speluncae]|uniref:TetR/AcrR family transcriptional regulator n=1 Tax=Microlunatus speluncae TaxID=2594267 RepID=UPI0012665744|nr:TetR/AcrR family transcriptional regulator [Microlunatus speluncae]